MASRTRRHWRVADPSIDMKTAVRKQVDALDIDAYFNYLAKLMKTNPPTAQDAPIVAQMAKIGLVPGQDFDPSKLSFVDREVIKTVPKLALLKMVEHLKQAEDHQRMAVLHFRRRSISAPTIWCAAWPTPSVRDGTVRRMPCIRSRKKMRAAMSTTARTTST